MAESRVNLVLGLKNQQFNSGLQATREEIDSTKESIDSLSASGVLLEGMKDIFKELAKTMVEAKIGEYVGELIPIVSIYNKIDKAATEAWTSIKEGTKHAHEAMEGLIASYQNDPFIAAAGKAQAYETQLTSLYRSSKIAQEQLKYMYDYAATTPFEMNGIIEAGIQLKSFGQNIRQFLPLATTLAAVAGTDVPSAATTLGKALSGVSEGFTSLQDTFRLTRRELKQFGAEMDSSGTILVKTISQQEKAAAAIEKAANSKFGDIVSNQVNTIEGAFSNLHDIFNQITTQIGSAFREPIIKNVQAVSELIHKLSVFVPIITFIGKNFTSLLEPIISTITKLTILADVVMGLGQAFEWTVKNTDIFISKLTGISAPIASIWTGYGALAITLGVATAATAAFIVPMAFAAATAAGTAMMVGKLSLSLAGILPQASLAARGLTWFGNTAVWAGGAAAATARALLTSILPLAAIGAALIAAAMVYRDRITELLDKEKEYEEQTDRLTNALQRNKDVINKTVPELEAMGKTSTDVAQAIMGLREENEKFLKNDSPDAKKHIAVNNAKIASLQKVKAALAESEKNTRTTGQNLLDDFKKNEDKKAKFETDRAKHVFETKQQEAEMIESIFQTNLKHIKLLEAEEKRAMESPDAKSEAGQKKIEDLKKYLSAAYAINKEYDIARIDANRDSVSEQINIRQQAMDIEMQLGHKGKADQIKDLQDILKTYKLTVEEKRDIENKLKLTILANEREIEEAKMSTVSAEKDSMENKIDLANREASFGHNRAENAKKEQDIIEKKAELEVELIKRKLALDNQIEGSNEKKAENTKRAEKEIASIQYKTTVAKQEAAQKAKQLDADQIQRNAALISSNKALLQSKLEYLNAAYSHGADNEAEIAKNRKAILIKEIDEVRAEEKSKLLVERNEDEKRKIKVESANKIKLLYEKNALETAELEIQQQKRVADRKVKDADTAEEKLANQKLIYEDRVQSGKESLLKVYSKEEEFAKRILDAKLKTLNADEKAQLVGLTGKDAEQVKAKFVQSRLKLQLEGQKQIDDAREKEAAAEADMREKEVQGAREVFEFKKEMGEAGLDSAKKEHDLIIDELKARLEAIEAHKKEAIASGDVKDAARIQKDAQLQTAKAIRESTRAMRDLESAQKGANSEADKMQAKYDKILEDIKKAHDILDEANKAPEEAPPTAEELRNNPGARMDYEAKLKIKENREAPEAKAALEASKRKESASSSSKISNDVRFKMNQDLATKMRQAGASQQEIKDAIYKQNQELNKGEATGGSGISSNAPGSTISISGATSGLSPSSSNSIKSGGPGGPGGGSDLSETNSLLRQLISVTAKLAGTPSPIPPKTDWQGKSTQSMSPSDKGKLSVWSAPGTGN